jgi:WW domain
MAVEKAYDEEHSRYYYFNKLTQQSRWESPLLLHGEPLVPEEVPAAVRVQTAFRAHRARRRIRAMLDSLYEKGYSKQEGAWFYYNKTTGVTSWSKPALYGVHEPPANEIDAAVLEKEDENR